MKKISLAKSCFGLFLFFLKKTLKYTCQQGDATNGHCEVLNMNLSIWFDIPSRYIENFCVIVSVDVDIFSERLTNTYCQNFSLLFSCCISLVMEFSS